MFRVHGNEDDATITVLELIQAVLESQHLCWAHEAECRRDKENDEPWCVVIRFSGLDGRTNVGAKADFYYSYMDKQVSLGRKRKTDLRSRLS